ncbi:hypothetical protein Pcinc_034882 [Petrolisthes cinctipes]|uniref:Uncharacterized protein n=1 Tax=Petrolisthes cinctipes TaxID=88211 RepID=A0AAE1EPN1_PETCI|nr:hypothetical protein Pcinc_034882 [Petrolisthes cinctipes]
MEGNLMEKYALNETNVTRELKENYSRDKPVTSGAKKPTNQPMVQLSLNSPQGPCCPLRHEPNEGRSEREPGSRESHPPPPTSHTIFYYRGSSGGVEGVVVEGEGVVVEGEGVVVEGEGVGGRRGSGWKEREWVEGEGVGGRRGSGWKEREWVEGEGVGGRRGSGWKEREWVEGEGVGGGDK